MLSSFNCGKVDMLEYICRSTCFFSFTGLASVVVGAAAACLDSGLRLSYNQSLCVNNHLEISIHGGRK